MLVKLEIIEKKPLDIRNELHKYKNEIVRRVSTGISTKHSKFTLINKLNGHS